MNLHAQSHLNFTTNNIITNPGATKQFRANLINSTTDTQYYRLVYNAGNFQIINTPPDSIVLAPNNNVFIPVILFVPRKVPASKPYYIILKAIDSNNNIVKSVCTLKIKEKRKVYLTASQPDIYLNPGQDTVGIQLQLHNVGNTKQQVKITVNEQATNRKLVQKTITLSGFQDTALLLKTILPSNISSQRISHLLVIGSYHNGHIFSTVQMNIFITGSRKSYAFNPQNKSGYNNMLAFYTHYIGTGRQYYEFTGEGLFHFNTRSNQIQYQMDALYYPDSYRSSLMLMNSYAKVLNNKWNIKAGNIYWNEEQLLNGRGIAFQLTPSASTTWELGYVNNSYNLAGKFNDSYFNSGNSVYADYTTVLKNKTTLNTVFVQQWDPSYKGNNTLGGGRIGFNIFRHHRIQLGAYTSYHTAGINKDSLGKWGAAASVDYSGTAGKWQMQSSNYLSTKSYAGYQKGAVNLLERINYRANNNFSFWVQYRKTRNQAEFIYPGLDRFNPSYSNEVAELGINAYFAQNLSFTARPYYSYENSKTNFMNSEYNHAIKAAHLDINLNYNASHKQSFYLKTDAGWSSSNTEAYNNYFAWKAVARYSIGSFSLNTSYQNSPYYSGELALYKYTRNKYALFNISPSFNGYLFNNKLMINASNSLSWEKSYSYWIYNINVNLSLKLKHDFNLVFNFNRINYFMFNHSITAFSVGIEKGFNADGQGKRFKLTIQLYEDKNGNYHQDEGDKPAVNQLVRIGHDLFRTNEEGKIEYRGIPLGSYHVSILQSNGMIAKDTVIFVQTKTNVYIPMHKIGKISGQIKLQLQQYSFETDKTISGIRIIAIDKSGKHFEARTDTKGNFSLYLPLNTYTLKLDTRSLPEKYGCIEPVKKINLRNKRLKPVTFTVLVQKRKIEIKKFQSSITK